MALAYATPGIVLGYRPLREADRLYSVLTPDRGKVELLARGSRKVTSKLAGSLEPLQLLAVEAVSGRQFDHVVGADRMEAHPAFAVDPSARVLALGLAGFLNAAVKPAEPDRRLFSVFRELLAAAGGEATVSERLLLRDAFLWKVSTILGFAADPARCAVCAGAPTMLSASAGGFQCAAHPAPPDAVRLSPQALSYLRAAHDLPLVSAVRLPLAVEDAKTVHRAVGLYVLYQFSGTVDPAILLRLFGDVGLAAAAVRS
ncbi:DNA repair protein RecO [Patescibacteria group bacterium]|nr:MAG: DNA repair protein RecO [Patescibacteria group bacterium]